MKDQLKNSIKSEHINEICLITKKRLHFLYTFLNKNQFENFKSLQNFKFLFAFQQHVYFSQSEENLFV